MDIAFVGAMIAFFALSVGLIRLCERLSRRRPAMNWMYWISGIAALAVFVYLVVALFKPELFS